GYLEENVGQYPWTYLTFADPPLMGIGAGGMEYTTLFTSMSVPGIPDYILLPEMVTVHEFGHAFFMGIIATNEFEEPWLDEGINSYWEQRIMDNFYNNAGIINHPLFRISDKSMARSAYIASPSRQAVSNSAYSWNYPHGTYSMISYQKAAAILHTLTGIVGEETMNEVFREYYRRWAFRHPSAGDFIDVVNATVLKMHGDCSGHDLNRFFEQTIYCTGICDYKVINIINRKHSEFHGLSLQPDSSFFVERKTGSDTLNVSFVQLQRDGEIQLPVDVLIRFDNGDEILEKWDGESRVKDFRYTGRRKVSSVKIDPEYKNQMDINFINNSMAVKPDHKPLKRLFRRIFSIMLFFMDFVLI
ncbi:MAG: M1 family metallopeptidase, partial [Bacteroidales bacterium]|nr:M1 family metallopeptidase [Bacteroidales bacterium]